MDHDMDQMKPPPNSSPEEIQAWNTMMDTMVTFIKASTNLMNTITRKVRSSPSKPGGHAKLPGVTEGCEPECEVCQPTPPCGTCGNTNSDPDIVSTADPTEASDEPPPKPPRSVQFPVEEEQPKDEGQPEHEEQPRNEENTEDITPAKDEMEPAAAPEEEPSPQQASPPTPSVAARTAGDKTCICAMVRAKREEDQQRERCNCKRQKKQKEKIAEEVVEEEGEPQPEPEVEQVCACATEGNTAAMVQEMVHKLACAQQEITELQEEMARLQRMDATKRLGPHAGPNPAALYREIMKDQGPPEQRCPPRPRLFQSIDSTNGAFFNPPNSMFMPADDPSRGMAYGSQPGSRPMMMRQPPLTNSASRLAGTPVVVGNHYPGAQSPCAPFIPCKTSSPVAELSGFESQVNPNYWGPNVQTIPCTSISARNPQPLQDSPHRRRVVCMPPRMSPFEGGNPDFTKLSMG